MGDKPEKLYKSLLDLAIPQQNEISKEFFKKKLNKKPLKSKFMVYENNFMWQADLMTVPENTSGLKYIFVCVDVSTRLVDAEPIPDKFAVMCASAFETILRRGIISEYAPKLLITDGGAEFSGQFDVLCQRANIIHRTTQPGRKQQTAIVEYMNGLISYALNTNAYRMRTTPLTERPKEYKDIDYFANDILPKTIERINTFMKAHYPKDPKEWFDIEDNEQETDIKVGDEVFVINVASDRIKRKYGQHDFLNKPFVVTRVFPPTLKKQPYRFMTSFSNKMTFKRDEMIKVNDHARNSHVIQFA
jgi:transposase InsO family protein